MAAVHIRNVPEETVTRLKERAASNGRSLEAELRSLLDEAAAQPVARKRRQINWITVSTGITEPFNRHDIYGDDDPDGR